jgi:hypothetical protein
MMTASANFWRMPFPCFICLRSRAVRSYVVLGIDILATYMHSDPRAHNDDISARCGETLYAICENNNASNVRQSCLRRRMTVHGRTQPFARLVRVPQEPCLLLLE